MIVGRWCVQLAAMALVFLFYFCILCVHPPPPPLFFRLVTGITISKLE